MDSMANYLTVILLIMAMSCVNQGNELKIASQDDFPPPPVAPLKPDTFSEFGNVRIDNYFWMKDRENPDVVAYLKAENAYFDTVMSNTKPLQYTLYKEMRARIKEDDQTVPFFENGYYYYSRTEKDRQYRIFCRKKTSLQSPEEIIFDVNKMAEGSSAFMFPDYAVSPDNKIAAYLYNKTGSYADFNLKFRNLTTGEDLDYEIEKVLGFVWANDSKTVFYVIANESLRPYRAYRHVINSSVPDKLMYEEKDDVFNLNISRSKTKEYIYLASGSFTTTEYRFLKADNPLAEFDLFKPRSKNVEYFIEHHKNDVFIKYKDSQHINGLIYKVPTKNYSDLLKWKQVVSHDPLVKIQEMEVFEKFLVLYIRKDGLNGIRIMDIETNAFRDLEFPEPVYVVNTSYVPEFTAMKYRYSYSSLNRPVTVYDYDMVAGTTEKLKEQEIPGGFNSSDYVVERQWATAKDCTKVPMAIVYKKSIWKDGMNPTLLYGYGSYGYNSDAGFRSNIFSLVDRGFVFAIAQIRGGSEMGESWYENGKLMKKMNSFTDFIACAEYLIHEKYTSANKLGITGGSAGGLLVGAVTNMRPDLFNVVIADVPFVDIINTMKDPSLPLTTQEYEQWGNPNKEEDYRYMLSYSPYDNVVAKDYPNILATGGWNDSQVLYHEPAKWAAKLRALKTDKNLVLLKINMDSGHGGATGRFDYLKEVAFRYAFLLDRMGLKY